MPKEIERKFLVSSDTWRTKVVSSTRFSQGYLPCQDGEPHVTARVRIAGDKAFLTLKGKASGLVRPEYEYEIPVQDAREMLVNLCKKPIIEKTRHIVPAAEPGLVWEIDEFAGENAGLILAEMEVPEISTVFSAPDWLGRNVTGIPRYYNSNLIRHPWSAWSDQEKNGDR